MRRFRSLSVLLVSSALLWPAAAWAQSSIAVSAELGFRSKYLFAGIPFAADQVTHATLTAAIGGFTLNGYAVFDHDASEVMEADIYGHYYVQLTDIVGVYVGGAFYSFKFPESWESTPEAYAGIAFVAPLNPVLHVAHDFDLGDGTLVLLTVSHSVAVAQEGPTLEFSGHLGYNDEYYTTESGLAYADVGVSLGIPLGPVTLSPVVVVQRRLDDAFEPYVPYEEVFGVTAAVAF